MVQAGVCALAAGKSITDAEIISTRNIVIMVFVVFRKILLFNGFFDIFQSSIFLIFIVFIRTSDRLSIATVPFKFFAKKQKYV
jgi:hypothetical protein